MKELGFTDSQAYQRIQAMRALRDIPELKPKIESGALSVSAISKVQTHFRRERKEGVSSSKNEKLELFQSVENCTSREVDMKLAEIRGETVKTKLVLELDEELAGLWKEVKNLADHRSQGIDTETFKMLTKEWLERNDPMRKAAKKNSEGKQGSKLALAPARRAAFESGLTHSVAARRAVPLSIKVSPSITAKPISEVNPNSRTIPADLRREIWARDEGKCTCCGSKHALEIDHRTPFALGGKTECTNLRLLCRSCNRFAAIQSFGVWKMAAF